MPITVPARGALRTRQARPLNGLEIREAVENHLMTLTDRLLSNAGLLSDKVIELTEQLRTIVQSEFSHQSRLHRVNVTYPKVGWSIKTRLQQLEDLSYLVTAEVELDLERNIRLNIQFGRSGEGIVLGSLEEEKIPTNVPDQDRGTFNLPITAEFNKPDGTTGTVDVRDLKRAARTVDVGSGAPNRQSRLIPTDEGTVEVKMAGVEAGQEIVLPKDLPEISLDDVVATPPSPPEKPLTTPLGPKGVNVVAKPNVKFKETK